MKPRPTRVAAAVFGLACAGCSFIQPSQSKAPVADTVGAILMGGSAIVAIPVYRDPSGNGQDFTHDSGYSAGVATLASLAALYALSAIYGFTRDPETQHSEGPILGLQILAAGLAGFGAGASAANHQGCCSYHGGLDSCAVDTYGRNRVVCADGAFSPSCLCE